MAPNGQRIFKPGKKVPLPKFDKDLHNYLNSSGPFDERMWFQLNKQTRVFYLDKNYDFTNKNDYQLVCEALGRKYPKIDVKKFRKLFSKSCNNHRQYLKITARDKEDEAPESNVEQDVQEHENVIAGNKDSTETSAHGSNQELDPLSRQYAASSTCSKAEKIIPTPLTSAHPDVRHGDLSSVTADAANIVPLGLESSSDDIRALEDANHANQKTAQVQVPEFIEFEEYPSNCQESEQIDYETSFDSLHRIKKRTTRPVPVNIKQGFEMCDQLRLRFLKHLKNGSSVDEETLLLFQKTFNHRTISIYNLPQKSLLEIYPCLQEKIFLEREIQEMYGRTSFKKMRENIDALLKALEKHHDYLNFPYAVIHFFKRLRSDSPFFQVFKDKEAFVSFNRDNSDHILCVLISNSTIESIKLLTFEMTIQVKSLAEGLLLQVLIHHVLEKQYVQRRELEFKVLESFVFGILSDIPFSAQEYIKEVSATFAELETMESVMAEEYTEG